MAFNMFVNPATKNYYDVLDLAKDASRKDIRAAYHSLALKYHPDKNDGDVLALRRFQDVQEAFDILGDADSKSEYDQTRTSAVFGQHNGEDNADEDIDQQIWDGWQASFDGQKSSLFSTPTEASYQGGYPGHSNQVEPPQVISTQTRVGDCSSFGNSDKEGHYAVATDATGGQEDAISISSDEDMGGSRDIGLSNPSPPSPNHWSFNDYWDLEYNEKPILQQMRDMVEEIKARYRNSCKVADKAKVDLNYATTPEEKVAFERTLRMRCDTRESCKKVKGFREANLKVHERLAKDCLRQRKKKDKEEEATAKKEAAILQKLRQHRQQRSKTASSGFGSYRVTKPRSVKRTNWYGADSGDESEGEWSMNTNWKP